MKRAAPKIECSLTALARLEGDEHTRTHAVSFTSLEEGRAWLDRMANGEGWCLTRPNELTISHAGGIRIRSAELDRILEAKPGAISDQYERWINQFRLGPWETPPASHEEPEVKRARVAKEAAPERAKRPEGFITVAEIAKQLKVKPFDIRQALRNSGAVKPEFGWAFDPKEVAAIKKLIAQKS